jgi:hypothetical protein
MRFHAPRILNEPVRWSVSGLIQTGAPIGGVERVEAQERRVEGDALQAHGGVFDVVDRGEVAERIGDHGALMRSFAADHKRGYLTDC